MDTIHFAGMPIAQIGRKYIDDEGFVVREGKIMETGRFPDKNFELNPEEADAALNVRVPNDIEHIRTVLTHHNDGTPRKQNHLGDMVLTRREGIDLFGKVRIPQWLDQIVGDDALKVSTTWAAGKKLVRNALCLFPRISDAAVFAAFTADPSFQDFAASHPEEAAEIVNAAKPAPAPAPPMPLTQEQLWAQFSAIPGNEGKKAEFDALFGNPAEKPKIEDKTAGDPALLARIAELEKQNAEVQAKFAKDEDTNAALGFYADTLQAGKCVPAEKEMVLTAFSAARAADRATLATFSANADGSYERKVRDQYGARAKQIHFGASMLPSHSDPQPANGEDLGGLSTHFAAEDDAKETK